MTTMTTMFEVSDEARAAADVWLAEHKKTCAVWQPKTTGAMAGTVYHGAIGGALSYVFTPTSIGTLITLQCACDSKFLCNGDEF